MASAILYVSSSSSSSSSCSSSDFGGGGSLFKNSVLLYSVTIIFLYQSLC